MNSAPQRVVASVIVPCRNPGSYFLALLESLAQQQFEGPWEVIVVDNGSTDGSAVIAESFSDRLRMKVIAASEKINGSYARNVGVRAAAGEKLLFVDSDDQVAPGYVAAMVSALDSHDFVTSRVDSKTLNPQWACEAQGPPWQDTGVDVAFDFLPATGLNVGVHRSLFESIGGFPEEYSGSQDIAFSWRIQLTAGASVHFVPEALYRYRHRGTLIGMYRQSRNWGVSNVLLYREFRVHGMPGKTLRSALWDWKDVLKQLVKARSKTDLAIQIVRLGYCVGRLKGSLRYRVTYL
jgi:glycosyltransferase involved in cell wall biosynthesis